MASLMASDVLTKLSIMRRVELMREILGLQAPAAAWHVQVGDFLIASVRFRNHRLHNSAGIDGTVNIVKAQMWIVITDRWHQIDFGLIKCDINVIDSFLNCDSRCVDISISQRRKSRCFSYVDIRWNGQTFGLRIVTLNSQVYFVWIERICGRKEMRI